jgi:SAM-dependent methyltransferase
MAHSLTDTSMMPNAKTQPHGRIADWWASNPMTYGRGHGTTTFKTTEGRDVAVELGSPRFFELADERFYRWNRTLHTAAAPFGRIFDYERFRGAPVLEIGCGMGCMAYNWARQGARITATDLNPVAVRQTRRRFDLAGLSARIVHGDGSRLAFADASYDYVYSWGVLHHFPATQQAIDEIWRVLKPGGTVGVMLYHRGSLRHLYKTLYLEGFLHWERHFLSPLQLASRYGDGARNDGNPHTWPVTIGEVHSELFGRFADVRVRVLGGDVPRVLDACLPQLGSRLLPRAFVAACARRWGWSLWITGTKR